MCPAISEIALRFFHVQPSVNMRSLLSYRRPEFSSPNNILGELILPTLIARVAPRQSKYRPNNNILARSFLTRGAFRVTFTLRVAKACYIQPLTMSHLVTYLLLVLPSPVSQTSLALRARPVNPSHLNMYSPAPIEHSKRAVRPLKNLMSCHIWPPIPPGSRTFRLSQAIHNTVLWLNFRLPQSG